MSPLIAPIGVSLVFGFLIGAWLGWFYKSFQDKARIGSAKLEAERIVKEVDMKYDNFYLVGGYRFPAELGKQAEADLKFKYLGKIAEDEQLDDYVLNGKSLIDLPQNNQAYISVKNILKTLGYL